MDARTDAPERRERRSVRKAIEEIRQRRRGRLPQEEKAKAEKARGPYLVDMGKPPERMRDGRDR
jgi:hypothetical protein